MAAYPYMVQSALNVLYAVFDQWQREPYRWIQERDIQAEIGGRLNQIFTLQGIGSVKGVYGWVSPGFDKEQTWSRVSFEPYVAFVHKGEQYRVRPDIVIWDDLKSNECPPKYDEGEFWPILWACEIKYGSGDDGSWDVVKLSMLLDYKKIKFGCAIRIHFVRDPKGVGINWGSNKHGIHLCICDISVPKKKNDANKPIKSM